MFFQVYLFQLLVQVDDIHGNKMSGCCLSLSIYDKTAGLDCNIKVSVMVGGGRRGGEGLVTKY